MIKAFNTDSTSLEDIAILEEGENRPEPNTPPPRKLQKTTHNTTTTTAAASAKPASAAKPASSTESQTATPRKAATPATATPKAAATAASSSQKPPPGDTHQREEKRGKDKGKGKGVKNQKKVSIVMHALQCPMGPTRHVWWCSIFMEASSLELLVDGIALTSKQLPQASSI
eukprot:6491157-Amphidinium_carterae.2